MRADGQAGDALAQWLLDRVLDRRAGVRQRVSRRVAGMARRGLLSTGDPVVRHRVAGSELLFPLSHRLPIILADHALYSSNLSRLVTLAAADRTDLTVVDIGANIGDSVALIRETSDVPVLAIEGDATFLPLLEHNMRQFADVEVEARYVAFAGAAGTSLTAVRAGGTAHLAVAAADAEHVSTATLTDILSRHPRFDRPGLMKIDTDGFDSRIIAAAADVLEASRPVLFFEFDPRLMAAAGDDEPLAVFKLLGALGYDRVIAYQNTGELLASGHVDDTDQWLDYSQALLAGPPGRYLDLAVYHADDDALAARSLASERTFLADWLRARGGAGGRETAR